MTTPLLALDPGAASGSVPFSPRGALLMSAVVAALAGLTGLAGCSDAEPGLADEATATKVDELHGARCDAPGLCARSRFVRVLGSTMHYREAGDPNGPPIVLLHGQPTWSYLYRNIIPRLPREAHIIAPDSIGYGFSGTPEIAYSWTDHVEYMEAFIEALDLRDVVLVVHDMGSFQGLAYAQRNPDNVRGLVMMESLAGPMPPLDVLAGAFPPGSPGAGFVDFLRVVKTDEAQARRLVVDDNYFLETLLPSLTERELTPRELAAYRYPFRTRKSREKLLTIPQGLPLGGAPEDNHAMVSAYAQYLATSPVKKLVLHTTPGLLFNATVAAGLAQALPSTTAEAVGSGLHFIQEDQPTAIAAAITRFFRGL